ncbi:unnamed protein product [Ostreobium quekettii]|uniref:SAP domain-containing protein n=1 Tax=Ostreobium quekettii TaxID=121088 RepID=A0A8S1ITQ2_9CHLO|nr:unnamed protein product [Ostreobium quekettii]|eukprot:evm.model.scf_16.13 EVM.evm.TU.scf_16.13   scf_16:157632-164404(-)
MDLSWVDKLKVVDLRKELRERGVSGAGKKAELADRLKQHLLKNAAPGEQTGQITTPAQTPPPGQEDKDPNPTPAPVPKPSANVAVVKKPEAMEDVATPAPVAHQEKAATMDIPQGSAEKVEVDGQLSTGDGAEAEKERGHKASADGKSRVLKETQAQKVDSDKKEEVEDDEFVDAVEPTPAEEAPRALGSLGGREEDMGIADILAEDTEDVDFGMGITPGSAKKPGEESRAKKIPEAYGDAEMREVAAHRGDSGGWRGGESERGPRGSKSQRVDDGDGDGSRRRGRVEVEGGRLDRGKGEDVRPHGPEGGDSRKRKLEGPAGESRAQGGEGPQELKRQRLPGAGAEAPTQGSGREPIPAPSRGPPKGEEASGEASVPPKPDPDQVSPALRIDNFVRPFTEAAAKEMLSAFGKVVDMWMPSIKTHCYVIFEANEEALAAYNATYKLEWPKNGGRPLNPRFVTVAEAKQEIDQGRARLTMGRGSGSGELNTMPSIGSEGRFGDPRGGRDHWVANNGRDRVGHAGAPHEPPRGVVPVGQQGALEPGRQLSLDELFNKTSAKPAVFWLPLTDEQVAQKKRRQAEEAAAAGGRREAGRPGMEARGDGGNGRPLRLADGNGAVRHARGREYDQPGMRRMDSRDFRDGGRRSYNNNIRRQRR